MNFEQLLIIVVLIISAPAWVPLLFLFASFLFTMFWCFLVMCFVALIAIFIGICEWIEKKRGTT